MQFSSRNVKGILMDSGGTTSHAAILARSMNIPTIVGVKNATDTIADGQQLVLDAGNGEAILNPHEETIQKYEKLIEQQVTTRAKFEDICRKRMKRPTVIPFRCGHNIEFTEELSIV
ncbi:MAG: PEP-utilizing enzyme [Fodinibius sp.]|nr:PEP-utilizing enzyme [Fodinibius sp.]